ncbi:MAG: hypothetical protein D6693_01885 [Planctomycetota bacterium]|nr:MAG: hypothetical protein D6693_01885 [Planctomycetota bacterium]
MIRPSALVAAIAIAAPAAAVTLPAAETFSTDAANWRDAFSSPLTWVSAGSHDGSAYASASFNFVNSVVGGQDPALIRAEASANASGGAFNGDWIAAGADTFSFFFRHNAPTPLQVFARFASPFNFPGAIALEFAPAAPNVWTEITFSIDPLSPQFLTFEGSDFNSVFSNVGNLQFGVIVNNTLAGLDQSFTFDIDTITLSGTAVPAPGAAALLVLAGLAAPRRRR